ncbi:hypothetical protein C8R42DRAFT_722066 [Lentinula raphanica]|nr:hypothetical protein C8R42DRAFT_722066 [Lentinula raphanica]
MKDERWWMLAGYLTLLELGLGFVDDDEGPPLAAAPFEVVQEAEALACVRLGADKEGEDTDEGQWDYFSPYALIILCALLLEPLLRLKVVMDPSSSGTSEPQTPRVRTRRNTAAAAGMTPTQQNPNYVPQEEEVQPEAGSKAKGRQRKRSTTASSTSQRSSRSRSSSRAGSAASMESSSSNGMDQQGIDEDSEEVFFDSVSESIDQRLSALEDKVVKKMMDSNAQLLADIKEAQVKAIEETMKSSIASGFTGLTSSVKELTQSIEGLNKNQMIQARLLNQLEARLDGARHDPKGKQKAPNNRPSAPSHQGSSKGKNREVYEEEQEQEGQGAGGSKNQQDDDQNENQRDDNQKENQQDDDENDDELNDDEPDVDKSGLDDDEDVLTGDADEEDEERLPTNGRKRAPRSKKELYLQGKIRGWIDDLVGGRQYCLDETVTAQEAKDFEEVFRKNPVAKPCTIDEFRYSINGKPSCAWNKGAALVFVQYIQQNRLMKVPDKATRETLQNGFLKRLRTLHGYYLRNKLSKDQKVERGKSGRKYARKSTRRAILDGLTPLRKYLPAFDGLGIPGMSSDEEDTDAPMSNTPQYKTTRPRWRSLDVGYFFELLDACHILVRMPTESATGTRYTRGAPPRFRIRTMQDSKNKAYVKGLPKNFYRMEWLEEQEQGWVKGGEGIVNLIICPKPRKALVFPVELKE